MGWLRVLWTYQPSGIRIRPLLQQFGDRFDVASGRGQYQRSRSVLKPGKVVSNPPVELIINR